VRQLHPYHCTGDKGKSPEPYAREEVLEACFADLLKRLVFDDEVIDWIVVVCSNSTCLAGHTGQSSQLFPVALGRNAHFLATVARSTVVRPVDWNLGL
jgi:hypothetical protein